MTTETLVKKLEKEVSTLRKELQEIKNMVVTNYRDPEGEYRPAFIKKMLLREKSRGPFYTFTDKQSFLKHVRSGK